jgi:hypothetical protein
MERAYWLRRIAGAAMLVWLVACGGGGGYGGGGNNGGTIASIVVTPGSAVLAPGATASFSATAQDSNGDAIDGVEFEWSSSDSAVATVSGGVASAVAEGTATIRASARGVSSNAASLNVRNAGTASSDELIDAALATGSIDDETALAYKVFATFGDPRLPAPYRGDDSAIFESGILVELDARYDTLSAATQALLAPYLLRPSDAGSWRDPAVRATFAAPRAQAHTLREQPLDRPTCSRTLDGWVAVNTINGKARVWYDTDFIDDGLQAHKVAGYLDNDVYPMLIGTLGFKEPLDDKRLTGCYGGDGRLDVYIVGGLAARGFTFKSSQFDSDFSAAQYILINPNQTDDQLKHSIAHEFTHAIHWAYQTATRQQNYGWFRDAFANWGADQVYSGNAALNKQASCHLKSPHLSLNDESSGYCEGASAISRNYGGYLPLQFLSKTRGVGIVKDILVATGSAGTAIEAIDKTVAGGFKAFWPEYARKLWNQDAVLAKDAPATFDDWDKLASNAPVRVPKLAPDQPDKFDADLQGSLEKDTPASDEVKNLSIRYYHYLFTEINTRSVMFHNTFYDNWKNGQAVSVRAFFRIESRTTWEEEDWTEKEWIGFCRDWKLQRIKQLVVVFASAEWQGLTNPKVIAAQAPELKRNVIGCWTFEGEAKRTDTFASSGKSGSVVVTFRPKFDLNPGNAPLQYSDPSTGRLRVPIAAPLFSGGTWTLVESYSQGGCAYAINTGGSSGAVTSSGGDSSALIMFNNFADALPAGLRPAQVTGAPSLAYFGEGHTNKKVLGTVTSTDPNVDCGSSYESAVGPWWLTHAEVAKAKVVNQADGRLKASYSLPDQTPGDSVVFTWELTPVRE